MLPNSRSFNIPNSYKIGWNKYRNLQQHESSTLKPVFGSFCSLCIQRHFKTVHNSPKKLNLAFEIWLYDFLLLMMDIG